MTLKRLPWEAPVLSDTSYRLFASPQSRENDLIRTEVDRAGDRAFSEDTPAQSIIIAGPHSLLNLLSVESRPILQAMLMLDPLQRANIHDIIEYGWIQKQENCLARNYLDFSGALRSLPPSSKLAGTEYSVVTGYVCLIGDV
jgi:serine/threonine protein kinase